MVWAARSHSLKEERKSAKEAAPGGWWSMETIWRQDGAKLADGLREGGLKAASGKEVEADVNCWHALATAAAGMTRGDIIKGTE